MLFHGSRFAKRVHDIDAEDDPAVRQILRVKAGSARTRPTIRASQKEKLCLPERWIASRMAV